ncbi:P-loop containing nucleoside triphosphate hydrolase protein, partial [Haematococcus lacustris]
VAGTGGGMRGSGRRRVVGRGASSGSDSGSEDEEESEEEDDAEWARLVTSGKMTKGDKLGLTDHSRMNYAPFRKAFYTEVPELSRMTPEQVATLRKELDGIKVGGVDVPKPIKAWTQAGLHSKVLEVLRKSGCTQPLPIQAQALPVIMSGRDCIGIAKTGSGKTLAFVLPLLRHAKDQPPLAVGDGPIGLIMAPTRELVQQISKEVKKLAKLLDMSCTAVFGGSGVANQISELKRGVEVVVCTPGRMIDLLATSNGKITNLRRVTYLVMDEADRMFDMGFEPQIMRIVQNIRPDKQTVMFSATFPRSVETLARKVLDNPVEIQVGGRSVVNSDITQIVEIRPEADRFLRLLEVLGEWYERGKLLIFVQSQDKCDCLFRDLLKHGYPCLSLHGGKDQMDRESTISDFKAGVSNILVATSVAARGLDVSSLVLVLNYDVPNHHEDYVHRVGRTGRAGAKGTAITFVGPDEDKYAPDLVKALKESGAPVPQDLQEMADGFIGKRKAGLVAGHGSGYGGSGFKFDAGEADKVKAIRKAAAKEFGVEADPASDSSDDDIRRVTVGGPTPTPQVPGPHPPPGNPPIFAIDMGSTTSVAAASAAAAAAASQVMNQQAAASHSQAMQALHMQGAVEAAVAAMAKQAAATQAAAAGASSGSGGQAQPPAINPAILMAQQVAARIGAGAVPGTLTASAPIMSAPPAAGVANPLVAAALSALPGVQLSRPAQGMIAPPRPPPISQLMAINPANAQTAVQRAAALASQYGSSGSSMRPGVLGAGGWDAGAAATQGAAQAPQQHYEAELEINDFPQHARWKVTHRDMVNFVAETTGAALIVKGRFVEPGKQPPPGERKIYMLIEGPTELSVKRAKQELKRVLEECTEKAMRRDAPAGPGRYSVV